MCVGVGPYVPKEKSSRPMTGQMKLLSLKRASREGPGVGPMREEEQPQSSRDVFDSWM